MSFANFKWENSNGIHQVEGQLEMAKDWNCCWKFFHFWEIFNLGRPPMRIKPPEKSLCFSTSFECAFEPLMIIFRAPPSPYLLVRLRALISFKCAFEPLIRIFRAFSSPYLLLRAPSSLISFKCAFKPLSIIFRALSSPYILSSAPSSPYLL
jgi:hypothetical protein